MLLLLASLTTAYAGSPLDGCLREDIKENSSRLDCGTHMVLRDGPFANKRDEALKALGKATGLEITADADTAILNGVETKLHVGKKDGQAVSLIQTQEVEGGLLITNCLTMDGSDSRRCKQLLDAVATIGFPTAESMTKTTVKIAGVAVDIPPGCKVAMTAEDGTAECIDGALLRWQNTAPTHEQSHEDNAFLALETGFRSAFPEDTAFVSETVPCEVLGIEVSCRALDIDGGKLRAWFGWATVGDHGALVTCATTNPGDKKLKACRDALRLK